MKVLSLVIIASVISGCGSTITKEASQVQLHNQVNAVVSDCEKLGPLQVSSSSIWSPSTALNQAKADLRQKALDQYGADTVVMFNSDSSFGYIADDANISGIAYNCFK